MSKTLDDLIPQTALDQFDRVPAHLTKVLSMLERWEDRLSTCLDSTVEGHSPDAPLASQLDRISKVSVAMAKELREWQKKRKEVVASMSLEDKLTVAMRLIQGLSVGDRYKFYESVNVIERSRGDGGIKLAVTHV